MGSLEHMGDLQMGGTQEQTYEEVVRGRKSIRGYLNKPVPRELIEEIIS